MRTVTEHGYATYPRWFAGYRWYKPLIVGALFAVFSFICYLAIEAITKSLFGKVVTSSGYDDMDFYTAAGAFNNAAVAVMPILCLLLAVLIVRDRPMSSYFSSMGGWRWGVFLKTLAAAFIILGMPTIIYLLAHGKTGEVCFTVGGFIMLTILGPLQGVAEELTFRGYIMQTVSSWFKLPIAGLIVQTIVFASVHPYNIVGVIEIVISAIIYALVCIYSNGLEAPSALHIINNMPLIYMAGFGFGSITAEQTVPDTVMNICLKIIFFLFVIFASRKLHWFDKVKCDDVAKYNAKKQTG